MPGAGCTRSLVCAWGGKYAHEYSQRGRRDHPTFPTQWFTAYFALSPEIGLSCLRRLRRLRRKLDASVEASGPHDFAVRLSAARQEHIRVHRIPSRVRDDREPPLMWDGTAIIFDVIWVEREQEYFCRQDWTGRIGLILRRNFSRTSGGKTAGLPPFGGRPREDVE